MDDSEAGPDAQLGGVLVGLNVLPYRAGYEEHDRSFIQELPGNLDDAAITKAIVSMANSLGLAIVAEVAATTALARSAGFTRLGPGVVAADKDEMIFFQQLL